MEYRTLAFDIDGTIINNEGKVDSKVMALFNKADLNKTTFIFLTGGTSLNALKALRLINKNLNNPTGKEIKAYYTSDCGAKIVSPDGKVIQDNAFSTDEIFNIVEAVRNADNGSAIIYATRNAYFIENQEHLKSGSFGRYVKNGVMLHLYKRSERKKGDMGIVINECNYVKDKQEIASFIATNGEIASIFIAPTSHDKDVKMQVLNSVKDAAQNHPLYSGRLACVAYDSKLSALKTILEIEKDNPKYADSVRQVVYFGDGTNDIEMLETCNLSIARGEKLKEKVVNAATIKLDDCTEFASKLYSGEYDQVISGNEKTL